MTDPDGQADDWWTANKRTLGVWLTVGSIVTLVTLAVLSTGSEPASVSTSALLVLISSALQVAAGWCFAQDRSAPLPHPSAQLRRLLRLVARLEAARVAAEEAFDSRAPAAEMRTRMGILSASLSVAAEDAIDIGQDWSEMFPSPNQLAEHEEEVPSEQN